MKWQPERTNRASWLTFWPDLSIVLRSFKASYGGFAIGRRSVERRVAERTSELLGIIALRDQMLRESQIWNNTVKDAPIGICFHEPVDGAIVLVNPAYAESCGMSADDLRGRPFGETFSEQERPRLSAVLAEADRTGRASYQTYHVRGNGSSFPVEVDVSSKHDVHGNVIYRIVCSRDITERYRIELEKEHQRQELEKSYADLEAFAYAASHDLRAPLSAILHLTEWITDDLDGTASPATSENLKLLHGRTTRLQTLLDGLLVYSRVKRGEGAVGEVDIAEVVRQIAARFSSLSDIVITADGPMPLLQTDGAAIRVVLENLIENGVRHHDRTDCRIGVSFQLNGEMAQFRVSDDGPGIAPRFHDRVFLMFQTLEGRDEVEASGIGLSIVKKTIEGHDGKIWVESAPPARGTTVIFTWKIASMAALLQECAD